MHFKNLFEFAINGREVNYAYAGGSIPPNSDPLWTYLQRLGITVNKQERGKSTGTEIAVDELIQLNMANRVLDCTVPETMLLLTGDGNGYSDGKGFIKQLERAHRHGWQVEVVTWEAGCNRYLRKFAQENGVYRSLESVYEQVTFIQNHRWAKS